MKVRDVIEQLSKYDPDEECFVEKPRCCGAPDEDFVIEKTGWYNMQNASKGKILVIG